MPCARSPSGTGYRWPRCRSPGWPSRPAVASVILGARTTEQLADNLAAAEVTLSPEETHLLDEASDPGAPDYPYGEPGQIQRDRRISGGRF